MNNKDRFNRNVRQYRNLTLKILANYFLSIIGLIAGIFLIVFIFWIVLSLRTWYDTEPVYWFFLYIKNRILILVSIVFFVGWVPITYYFISKPFHYLDEIAEASKQLATPTQDPILLSEPISYVERELNLVRETALENARVAKDAEQRKNDLVVYLAHDLKTPLTSVIGYLTLLHDEKQISEELREKYLSISLEKAERLEDLINEFFEITRFNLSEITLEYSRVNLTRLLEQLTYEFRPMFLEKNLKCTLQIAPDTMVKCDVNKMQRVFDNLLRNAVNYSFVNGTIAITAAQKGDDLHITFRNDGNTIPPEKLQRIFEQFYRLDTSRSSKSGGAGLGLAIAKEIVEHHHGTITARSENETIEFEVTLPLS